MRRQIYILGYLLLGAANLWTAMAEEHRPIVRNGGVLSAYPKHDCPKTLVDRYTVGKNDASQSDWIVPKSLADETSWDDCSKGKPASSPESLVGKLSTRFPKGTFEDQLSPICLRQISDAKDRQSAIADYAYLRMGLASRYQSVVEKLVAVQQLKKGAIILGGGSVRSAHFPELDERIDAISAECRELPESRESAKDSLLLGVTKLREIDAEIAKLQKEKDQTQRIYDSKSFSIEKSQGNAVIELAQKLEILRAKREWIRTQIPGAASSTVSKMMGASPTAETVEDAFDAFLNEAEVETRHQLKKLQEHFECIHDNRLKHCSAENFYGMMNELPSAEAILGRGADAVLSSEVFAAECRLGLGKTKKDYSEKALENVGNAGIDVALVLGTAGLGLAATLGSRGFQAVQAGIKLSPKVLATLKSGTDAAKKFVTIKTLIYTGNFANAAFQTSRAFDQCDGALLENLQKSEDEKGGVKRKSKNLGCADPESKMEARITAGYKQCILIAMTSGTAAALPFVSDLPKAFSFFRNNSTKLADFAGATVRAKGMNLLVKEVESLPESAHGPLKNLLTPAQESRWYRGWFMGEKPAQFLPNLLSKWKYGKAYDVSPDHYLQAMTQEKLGKSYGLSTGVKLVGQAGALMAATHGMGAVFEKGFEEAKDLRLKQIIQSNAPRLDVLIASDFRFQGIREALANGKIDTNQARQQAYFMEKQIGDFRSKMQELMGADGITLTEGQRSDSALTSSLMQDLKTKADKLTEVEKRELIESRYSFYFMTDAVPALINSNAFAKPMEQAIADLPETFRSSLYDEAMLRLLLQDPYIQALAKIQSQSNSDIKLSKAQLLWRIQQDIHHRNQVDELKILDPVPGRNHQQLLRDLRMQAIQDMRQAK